MLTPQEVAQRAFSKATFGGYNMSMVDEFLDVLTEDYTALYKENAVLKSKMKVLVDKIEEYRATEEAMRSALLTAQKMANSLVAEAEEKKAQLLREAENVANARILELQRQISSEELRLTAAQKSTADFTAQMRQMLAQQSAFLDSLPELEAPAVSQTPVTDEVAQTAKAIEDSIQKLMGEEAAGAHEEEDLADTRDMAEAFQTADEISLYEELTAQEDEEDAPPEEDGEDEDEDDTAATRRIDFAHLQFGRDYEIR